MKNQTCCFAGHRIIPAKDYSAIKARLEHEIVNLVDQGVCYFGAGGAVGFDTMAAQAILKLKPEYPHIRLILVLPCKDQTKNWREKDKKIYDHILDKADKVVYTSEYYHKGCMHKRNRYLVDNSDFCICYLTQDSGGTAYTAGYARQKGLRIINVAMEDG